jgi:hypothetical protein
MYVHTFRRDVDVIDLYLACCSTLKTEAVLHSELRDIHEEFALILTAARTYLTSCNVLSRDWLCTAFGMAVGFIGRFNSTRYHASRMTNSVTVFGSFTPDLTTSQVGGHLTPTSYR